MLPSPDLAVSLVLGIGMGLAASSAAVIVAALVNRVSPPRSYMGTTARGSGLRMLGAVAGVLAGVGLGPPSVATFVVSFLVVFLAANAILFFRFDRPARP